MKKALLLLLLLSVAASALSSVEATEKAKIIIGDANIQSLPQALDVGSDAYWVFFQPIETGNAVIIAISDTDGSIETNQKQLRQVAGSVYDYTLVKSYLKQKKIDFNSLKPSIANMIQVLRQNTGKTNDLIAKIESKNYALDLGELGGSTESLLGSATDLEGLVNEGSGLEQDFDATFTADELPAIITEYNATYDSIIKLTFQYDDYKQTISTLQSRVFKSNVPDPDNKNIYDSLEALTEIGISDLYSLRLSDPRGELKKRLAQKEIWVNESVDAFFFIKNKKEAEDLYNKNYQTYQDIIQSTDYFNSCNAGGLVKNLTRLWSDVEYLRAFTTAKAYFDMASKLRQAETLIAQINAADAKCRGSTVTVKPSGNAGGNNDDLNAIIIALVVGLVAYLGFTYYQKTQQKEKYE